MCQSSGGSEGSGWGVGEGEVGLVGEAVAEEGHGLGVGAAGAGHEHDARGVGVEAVVEPDVGAVGVGAAGLGGVALDGGEEVVAVGVAGGLGGQARGLVDGDDVVVFKEDAVGGEQPARGGGLAQRVEGRADLDPRAWAQGLGGDAHALSVEINRALI